MNGRFLFLGTGGSMGVPAIACSCEVCRSESPYNQRSRPGYLLTINDRKIFIDASQDIRDQVLRHHIMSIDGVILTHAHHDHTAGVDDLRAFYAVKQAPLSLLLSEATFSELKKRFAYIFCPEEEGPSLIPRFNIQFFGKAEGMVEFLGIQIHYFTFHQAGMAVNGFRIGNFAFLSDIREYPESIFDILKGVDTLVVSALRFTPSHLHFTVDEAVAFTNKVGAKRAYLTHLAHDLDYERTNAYLPEHIRLAYDGLEIII